MTGDMYRKEIVNDDGVNINKTPYFISFVKGTDHSANKNVMPLRTLTEIYKGDVQFVYIDSNCDEDLRMSYDVYQGSRHFYIDTDGQAYLYPSPLIGSNSTSEWINERKYRSSPF